MKNREPWNFCETPKEKCTMNYCDENGCQNRKRNYIKGNDLIADVMRSSSNDKLVEIAVPENSLILTVNATKHHNRKLFKEWMKEFFDDDVNFA